MKCYNNQCYQLASSQAFAMLEEEYGTGLKEILHDFEPPEWLFDIDNYEPVDFEGCIELMTDELYELLEEALLAYEDIPEEEQFETDCPHPECDCSECGLCRD